MAQFSFIPSGETAELTDDLRELFQELAADLAQGHRAYSGECRPTLDVLETDDTIEVVVDVAGVPPRAIRLTGAFDIQNSRATVADGELTIVLPKLLERRGRAHQIPVNAAPGPR